MTGAPAEVCGAQPSAGSATIPITQHQHGGAPLAPWLGTAPPAPGSGVGVSVLQAQLGLGRYGTGLSPCSSVEFVLLDSCADMEFLEVLTEHLDRALLVRGGGREVITIYS